MQRQTKEIRNLRLAQQIKSLVSERLKVAQSLGATWDIPELESTAFTLMGHTDSIRVRVGDPTTLYFCSNTEPGYICSLYKDGTLLEHVGDLPGDLHKRVEHAARMSIGLPEQAYYGWVSNDLVTTMVMSHRVESVGELLRIPGLSCAVLQGTTLPRQLRMPSQGSEQDVKEWCGRFWPLVQEGKIIRLGARIKALPGEFWLVCKNQRAYFYFDATDEQLPRLVPQKPYYQQHPREEYPGELNLISGWLDCKNPLRSVVI